MENDKEKYLKLIRQSKLFCMQRVPESSAYQREALRMIEYLYCYLVAVNASKYADMGLEITETARRCIRSFQADRGEFLPYFLAAWKQEYKRSAGRKIIAQRYGGIGFTEEEQRNIKRYARLAASHGNSGAPEELVQRAAQATEKTPEEVRKIQELTDIRVESDSVDRNGVEYNLFDSIDSGERVEDELLAEEAAAAQLRKIEDEFNGLQNRQKPLLSCLITAKIARELSIEPKLLACAGQMSFFDPEAYYRAISSEAGLSAREIATDFGLNEASVSRSWRRFREKLELR